MLKRLEIEMSRNVFHGTQFLQHLNEIINIDISDIRIIQKVTFIVALPKANIATNRNVLMVCHP